MFEGGTGDYHFEGAPLMLAAAMLANIRQAKKACKGQII
jgi:hypothetical protein